MSSTNWSLTDNIFDNVTKDNFSKMRIIAPYTKAVLTARQNDPEIAQILAAYAPVSDNYVTLFDTLLESRGEHIGSTVKVRALLKQLSGNHIRKWDVAIQKVYDLGTPDYIRLLPNRRKPFQQGKQDQRDAAVAALIKAIGTDAALATLKGDIQAFYTLLKNAIKSNRGNFGTISVLSTKTEDARIVTAQAMMTVYFSLGMLNVTNLKKVDAYFDLPNIQNKRQTTYNHQIPARSFNFILLHTFKPTDTFKVVNTGDAILDFGLSQTRKEAFTTVPYFTVAAHKTATGTGSQVIKSTFRFFMVVNNTDLDGSYVLTTGF